MGPADRAVPPRELPAVPAGQPERVHGGPAGRPIGPQDAPVLQRQPRGQEPELPGLPRDPERARDAPAVRPLLAVPARLQHQRQGPQRVQPADDDAQRLCLRREGEDFD